MHKFLTFLGLASLAIPFAVCTLEIPTEKENAPVEQASIETQTLLAGCPMRNRNKTTSDDTQKTAQA